MKRPLHLPYGLSFGMLLVLVITWGCSGKRNEGIHDQFSTIESHFMDPPAEYRGMPLWVWNDEVTEEKLERMLIELKEHGFGGLFVHPRPGLITEYLSEDWLTMYAYTLRRGKELGLEVWIYDENSYPSGFAGGHVPEQMPESYNQGQGLLLEKQELLPVKLDNYLICLKREGEQFIDITDNPDEYTGKKGEYYLYSKSYYGKSDWYGGYSYVDLLVEGVTEKFIEVTMKGYEECFGNEFGKGIPGVFTDEPNIVTSGGMRWTPDLFDRFQNRWGYDLKLHIPLLSEEIGDWKRVRHNYMESLLQLFIDRWSKPWFAYTEKNNLNWTGHYWEHGWPQMNDGPDNMAMYAWHQVPAIDMLFNQFNEESPQAQFGNIRAVKELRSAANQTGARRTLSETYGGGGWEVSFKDLKRLGDWEFVLGVNFMNQHLAHMTLEGARKYDYPPVFTYHSPWFANYGKLNDYFARLSLVMSHGKQQNDILVIEPNATLWGYYSHTQARPELMEIGTSFQSFVTLLEKNQIEYDLGSENIIKDHGKVVSDRLCVGEASYHTVVIPPLTETINRPTFNLLKQFAAQGGRIVSFATPERLDGAVNEEITTFFSSEVIDRQQAVDQATVKQLFASKDLDIIFSGGNLFHHRRLYGDGELIYLVNSSMEEAVSGKLYLSGETLLEMDALEGDIYSYATTSDQEGRLTASFRIEPAGSLMLYSSYKSRKSYPPRALIKADRPVAADAPVVVCRTEPNALNIDLCDLTINGKTTPNIHFSNASKLVFNTHGFPNGNPWNSSVQYKQNILDRGNFTDGGFTATYRFTVSDAFDYSSFRLVAERPQLFKVKVNGHPLSPTGDWKIDKAFAVYDIGKVVKQGENRIELTVSPMHILAEIEPVYILGDFTVNSEAIGWSIGAPVEQLQLGSWKEQGQPLYSYGMRYSQSFTIKQPAKGYVVELGDWNGTVAEVYVNGKKAGIIGFNPYRLDVSSEIKAGINRIEVVVIGSLKNLLGPHYNNPAPGLASPWHWNNSHQFIPGNHYQLIDYGLFENFRLLSE